MSDKARELLEQVIAEADSSHFYSSEIDKEIRAYLAEPEVKREALSAEVISTEYLRLKEKHDVNILDFLSGVRFAEKHHGIGGGNE